MLAIKNIVFDNQDHNFVENYTFRIAFNTVWSLNNLELKNVYLPMYLFQAKARKNLFQAEARKKERKKNIFIFETSFLQV